MKKARMLPWWRFVWDLAADNKRLAARLRDLEASYTSLTGVYYDTATALEAAQQRAAKVTDDLKFVLSQPCECCDTYRAERDDALLERDAARQVSAWLEQLGWGTVHGGAL